MDDMTLLSTEAEGVNDTIPEDFKPTHVNSAGRVGALLGLTDDGSPSGKPALTDWASMSTTAGLVSTCPSSWRRETVHVGPARADRWSLTARKHVTRLALLHAGRGAASVTAIPDKVEGTPLTDVLLVNIKLLTLSELKLITDHVRPGPTRSRAQLPESPNGFQLPSHNPHTRSIGAVLI